MNKITIGSDPEVFLKDLNGNLISSIGKIGGSKKQPRPLGVEGFFVQEDNVALEFNIPPAKTVEEFTQSIHWAITKLSEEVKTLGLQLHMSASEIFPEQELQSFAARQFGCEPDYNAWTRHRNPRPRADNLNLRSCGGHIHVGWSEPNTATRENLIRAMDLFLGVPSTIMDSNTERRKLYGRAGCFRPTDYGVEYRTLSNFWLKNKKYTEWAYHQTQRAWDYIADAANVQNLEDKNIEIQYAINENDNSLQTYLIESENLSLV